jgi:glutathione S-transferase
MSDPAFKLYGRRGAGSLAVQIVLEEIRARYEIEWVERTPEALEALKLINPAGKIPALALPDGRVVSESAAILIYLTSAYPAAQLAPAGGSAYAHFLQWMVYLSANLYDTALRYYYAERYSIAGATAAAGIKAQAVEDYAKHLGVAAQALAPYLAGETFSAADPYLYMIAGWYPGDMEALYRRLPQLARHAELLRQRASVIKSERDHAETA